MDAPPGASCQVWKLILAYLDARRAQVTKKPRLELIIKRKATGMNEAIWFGGLAGGYEFEVVEFSEDMLRIE
ncbi:MAG: hypothetical protein QF493_04700 [Rhodospirillales bacterium]|nr:hypothetical protein [Rhodospirillales bacterium]